MATFVIIAHVAGNLVGARLQQLRGFVGNMIKLIVNGVLFYAEHTANVARARLLASGKYGLCSFSSVET
jgi:hypothetical protein